MARQYKYPSHQWDSRWVAVILIGWSHTTGWLWTGQSKLAPVDSLNHWEGGRASGGRGGTLGLPRRKTYTAMMPGSGEDDINNLIISI